MRTRRIFSCGGTIEQTFKLKEPKTFDEQLQILKSRNMIVDNEEETIKILKRTNYYRFTAYALQFKDGDNYNNKVSFETTLTIGLGYHRCHSLYNGI